MSDDEEVVRTLLLESHRCIEGAAEATVDKIGLQRRKPAPDHGPIDPEALLTYPETIVEVMRNVAA